METLSPSFFNQREICPSSIVGESFGMITFVAIRFLRDAEKFPQRRKGAKKIN
jgi:hypothetical protein